MGWSRRWSISECSLFFHFLLLGSTVRWHLCQAGWRDPVNRVSGGLQFISWTQRRFQQRVWCRHGKERISTSWGESERNPPLERVKTPANPPKLHPTSKTRLHPPTGTQRTNFDPSSASGNWFQSLAGLKDLLGIVVYLCLLFVLTLYIWTSCPMEEALSYKAFCFVSTWFWRFESSLVRLLVWCVDTVPYLLVRPQTSHNDLYTTRQIPVTHVDLLRALPRSSTWSHLKCQERWGGETNGWTTSSNIDPNKKYGSQRKGTWSGYSFK